MQNKYKPCNCEVTLSSSIFTSVSLPSSTIKICDNMISGHSYLTTIEYSVSTQLHTYIHVVSALGLICRGVLIRKFWVLPYQLYQYILLITDNQSDNNLAHRCQAYVYTQLYHVYTNYMRLNNLLLKQLYTLKQ